MNSQINWGLQIDRSVLKFFSKVPHKDTEALMTGIKLLSLNPYFGDLQKMKGEENSWRRRIGSYRIFFKIKVKEKIILVFNMERRTSSTY